MIQPLGQFFGATERRAMRAERRHQVNPAQHVNGVTHLGSRQEARAARKAKRGDGVSVLAPKQQKAKRQIFLGPPVPVGTGTGTSGAGVCGSTPTVGKCLQCCAHTYANRKDRKACKQGCLDIFGGGSGGAGTGCSGATPYTCPDGSCAINVAGCPSTQQQGSGCGIVCVSGTHGNQEDCHYECPDYGGGTPPAPGDLGGITPIGSNGSAVSTCSGATPYLCPDGSCAPDSASCPATDFWTQYETPFLVAAGIVAAIVAIKLAGKRGR
jgi:hypothetical protein